MHPTTIMSQRHRHLLVVLHLILILAAFTAPFWLDWRVVAAGVALFFAQLLVWGGCVLSIAQFGDHETTFHEWYLRKLGFQPDPRRVRIVVRGVLPPLLALTAYIWQVALRHAPLVGY